jgi:hypothetical protein
MPSFEQFDNLETGLSVRTKINLVIAEVSDHSTEWSAAYSWTQNAELSSLNNVITAGALDDEVLAYSSLTGNWTPKSLGSITNPLAVSDLTDTVISALADKDVLQWNGTNWLNATLSIKDLSDVSDSLVTTPGINTTWRILSYVVGVGWTATVPDLDALESVSNTAPSSVGQVLRWSGSFWTPSLLGVDDLSGVSDAPPSAAGQVLRWNGSLWTPSLLDVGDLESINLSGLSTNDVLQWNGSSWVPVAMSGGGGASALNDLTDVNAPSPALNQVLTWNGSEWAPAAGGGGGGAVDSIVAGSLVDVSSATGNVTVSVDLSELVDMTAALLGTDELVVLDGGVQRRKAVNEIGLSVFNNDANFFVNGGTGFSSAGYRDLSTGSFGITVTTGENVEIQNILYVGVDETSTMYLDNGVTHPRPALFWDTNDYIDYDRGTNTWDFVIGGTTVASFDSTGLVGGGGGATSLNDLTDVDLSAGVSTFDILFWNGANFVPSALTYTLDAITDVDAAAPSNGQVLKFNSTSGNWEAADDLTGGGGATELADLTDVDASVGSPSDGNILVYRSAGNDWVLEAKPAAGSNPAAADITDATADGIALITSADANPFTDADELKLDGIEASADVTDAANVAAAGAAMASNNLSDLANAATARTNLGVDAAGTDNSTDVTLAGTPNYLTIAGQVITRGLVDLSTDVTGSLPEGSVTGLTASLAAKAAVANPVFEGAVATIDDSDTPRFATVWDVPALADVEISRWQGNSLDSNSALQSGAKMAFYAEENWDATSNATRIEWWATNSAGSFAKRMEMSSGGDLDVEGYVKADEIILGTKNYGTATPATTGYSEGSIFFVHA